MTSDSMAAGVMAWVVPCAVWALVIIGLIKVVRDTVRERRPAGEPDIQDAGLEAGVGPESVDA